VGIAATIGSLSVGRRRTTVVVMLLYSAAIILVAAEPFVDSLVDTGLELGIDEFTLIQWIAPVASESPEIIIAILFTLRANPMAGITTLISAEVNQLTLLVGSMVAIFSLSAGEPLSFPLDSRQSAEFLLTSAVSAFAIVLIAPRLIGWQAGGVLLTLFVVHLFFVDEGAREIFAYLYLAMAVGLIALDRRRVRGLIGGVGD
jgi:cation:H+ antiporter